MNKDYILFHLGETREALDQLITALRSDPDYEFGNFSVDMSHLYHHLNTAWNARDASKAQAEACSESDFMRWRQFPVDDFALSG